MLLADTYTKQKHNMIVIEATCAEEYVVIVTYNAIEMKDTMMLMWIKYEVNIPL